MKKTQNSMKGKSCRLVKKLYMLKVIFEYFLKNVRHKFLGLSWEVLLEEETKKHEGFKVKEKYA